MGNGTVCCFKPTSPTFSMHSLSNNPKDINLEEFNLNFKNDEILSHLSSLRFKPVRYRDSTEHHIKQVFTGPMSTNTSTILPPPHNAKTKIPKKQKTNYISRDRARSAIQKIVTKGRRQLHKAFSVDKNIIQHFHYIVHNNLCDFSKKINLNTGVYDIEFSKYRNNSRDLGDNTLKIGYEELQEPFSAKQIAMIKRILFEEEMLIDAMDDNTM